MTLTIGIPTCGNRPERLTVALDSALEQVEPAEVVVAPDILDFVLTVATTADFDLDLVTGLDFDLGM